MNSADKLTAKRVVQVLLPGAPAPLIDFAVASFERTQSAALSSASTAAASPSSPGSSPPASSFTLRKMDSGEWGELSLVSPPRSRHTKNNSFGEPSALCFTYEQEYAESARGRGSNSRASQAHVQHRATSATTMASPFAKSSLLLARAAAPDSVN